jgi:cytochrome P450
MPVEEAELWISWGTHVFHSSDGINHGAELEAYLNRQFDRAGAEGGDDFFAELCRCELEGWPLTREEKLGFGNLAFAGGRDTVINSITGLLAHLANTPQDFERMKTEPRVRNTAAEELFRWISPITHIGRVCPHATELNGHPIPANGRVSLNWAAANRDPEVFEDPDAVRIDRVPNPHVAFGSGHHACLGSTHARTLIRCLLNELCEKVATIEMLEATPRVEQEAAYRRENGYDRLQIGFHGVQA